MTTSPPTQLILWQPSWRSVQAIVASVRGSVASPLSLSVLMSPVRPSRACTSSPWLYLSLELRGRQHPRRPGPWHLRICLIEAPPTHHPDRQRGGVLLAALPPRRCFANPLWSREVRAAQRSAKR